MTKILSLALAALFALTTIALAAPPATATPQCNMNGSCCPTVGMCTCALCGLPPLVIPACHAVSQDVSPAGGATWSSCEGGSAWVCTSPRYQNPVSPKPGRVVCDGETTLGLP